MGYLFLGVWVCLVVLFFEGWFDVGSLDWVCGYLVYGVLILFVGVMIDMVFVGVVVFCGFVFGVLMVFCLGELLVFFELFMV